MGNTKFYITTFIFIIGALCLGYFALQGLKPVSEYTYSETSTQLTRAQKKIEEEKRLAQLQLEQETALNVPIRNDIQEEGQSGVLPEEISVEETVSEPASTNTNQTSTISSEQYANLIGRLERLIADKVLMDTGSRGTRVGTVQEFLNIYNKTNNRIDNDYGPGTKSRVQAFQRAEGLTADGQAGPNTYQKMIDWLKKQ